MIYVNSPLLLTKYILYDQFDHTGYLFKNIFYFYRCEGLDILLSMSRWKNKTITHT
uniref:Uncharacterized protein n=1 Tax=Myoviridae sp. ctcyQ27 TaxID=2825139 RepID=A0A8S5UFU3_9CAUD|nr:MAG TPA: hypothetical protein [Myoviridae sp. ctcyQ27]